MNTDKDLIAMVKEMFKVDQDIRNTVIGNRNLLIPLAQFGKTNARPNIPGKQSNKVSLGSYLVYMADQVHNAKIKNLIRDNGYPSKVLLGKQGMHYFWLLIQHQDVDRKLQRQCLEHCEFSPSDKALLTDRILIGEGKKQIYGTQYHVNKKGVYICYPIANPKQVRQLRKAAGLGDFEKYNAKMLARMNKMQKRVQKK